MKSMLNVASSIVKILEEEGSLIKMCNAVRVLMFQSYTRNCVENMILIHSATGKMNLDFCMFDSQFKYQYRPDMPAW